MSPSPPAGPDRPSSIPPTADPEEAGEPGLFDISGRIRAAVVDLFAWLVADALNPILGALGETLLATPDLTGNPHVLAMWSTSRTVANGLLILAVLAAAFLLTGHETVQTRYGFKQLAPRLVVAAILANASLPLCRAAITVTNAVTAAIVGQGAPAQTAAQALTDRLAAARTGVSFLLTLLWVAVLVMAVVVVATFVLRIAAMVGAARRCPARHALPRPAADGTGGAAVVAGLPRLPRHPTRPGGRASWPRSGCSSPRPAPPSSAYRPPRPASSASSSARRRCGC